MTLTLRYSATSDVGRVRRQNQDSGFASAQVLVVADGMGGAAAGDLASAVTVETLRRLDSAPPEDMLEALAGAVHRANDRLGEIIDENPQVEGMGTTVTAAIFDGTQLGLAHVGDSRAYLLRDGEIVRLTHDHTFVQGMIDEGRITEAEARTHPHRSLILRALDGRHESEPDLSLHELRQGDRLLFCSDGLCGFVEDDTIAEILGSGTPDSAAVALLQRALDSDSSDNVTCVVAEAVDSNAPIDPDSAAADVGPMLVGSAAEQARGRLGDTASQSPISAGDEDEVDREFIPDPEELRYAPQPPRRFRWLRRLVVLVLIAAVLGVAGWFAYEWTQQQYYVSASDDNVVIYRGVDADIPLVSLASLEESSPLELPSLPTYWRDRVTEGIDASDLNHARDIVDELTETAEACEQATEEPDPDGPGGGDGDDDMLPPDPACEGAEQ